MKTGGGDLNNPTNKCKVFQYYAKCAVQKGCFNLLDVWCNGFFNANGNDCSSKIAQCKGIGGACDTEVWQRCLHQLSANPPQNHCDYQKQYLGCATFARCPDLAQHFCDGVDASCVIPQCQKKSSLLQDEWRDTRDFDSSLNYGIPMYPPQSEHTAQSTPKSWAVAAVGGSVGLVAIVALVAAILIRSSGSEYTRVSDEEEEDIHA